MTDLPTSQAEFALDFQPRGDGGGDGGRGDRGDRGSRDQDWEFTDDDIIQEMVSENGQEFYHVIITDSSQDFALDFYIRTASPNGFYPDRSTGPASSSYGDGGPDLEGFEDPFQFEAGTGTANPQRVYMRMILRDENMEQEFLKGIMAQKPIITQTIVDAGFLNDVVIDMTNSNYSEMNTAGNIDIQTVVNLPSGVSEFELSRDGDQVHTTAGKFKFTPGSGPGGSLGTYEYFEGDFDVLAVDWLDFCDPSQNQQHDCNFDGSNRGSRGGRGGRESGVRGDDDGGRR